MVAGKLPREASSPENQEPVQGFDPIVYASVPQVLGSFKKEPDQACVRGARIIVRDCRFGSWLQSQRDEGRNWFQRPLVFGITHPYRSVESVSV